MSIKIITHLLFTIIFAFIFLKGYFPVQQNVLKDIKPPTKVGNIALNLNEFYTPEIEKLIFIVLDALRYDFVTKEKMPFTFKEKQCLLKVKVESPTVTLPRIKSLTMGNIPQFIDIALNLGGGSEAKDSFLHKAHEKGKKMVFFGDNTWLKLYPNLFERHDGTTSFFVQDFTEVDDNVTRHIREELDGRDWDLMFLHYLGLDHIGHVKGPFSNLIKLKLLEMDQVIETIIKEIEKWPEKTMLLVTGDHGMKDSGGHGGTTYAETHVPLVVYKNFKSSNKKDKIKEDNEEISETLISQSDIATTISLLFGFEISSNSIGKVIPTLFEVRNYSQLLYKAYYNAIFLGEKSKCCLEDLGNAHNLYENLLKFQAANVLNETEAKNVFSYYQKILKQMNDDLIKTSVKQDLKQLLIGILGTFYSLLSIMQRKDPKYEGLLTKAIWIIIFTSSIDNFYFEGKLDPFLVGALILLVIFKMKMLITYFKDLEVFVTIALLLHIILLLSSSFIEEEHQIFYYYLGTFSILTAVITCLKQGKDIKTPHGAIAFLIIVFLRLVRTLNSTGDQWASHPDLAGWFSQEENEIFLAIFHAISLFLTYFTLKSKNCYKHKFLRIAVLVLIFYYKNFVQNHNLAKFIWFLIVLQTLFPSKGTNVWILGISFLLRPYNVILIPICYCSCKLVQKYVTNFNILAISHYHLGYAMYFCQGHSNNFASVDLVPGYIGLNSYIPFVVIFLTICHIYAFPTLIIIELSKCIRKTKNVEFPTVFIVCRLLLLLVIYVVMFIQQGHLFVWSVFAPKLLIEVVHTCILFIQVSVFYIVNYQSFVKYK